METMYVYDVLAFLNVLLYPELYFVLTTYL